MSVDAHDLVSVAVQVPIVALCFYFIAKEVNALSKKVDEHWQLALTVISESNKVQREMATAVSSLVTLIENSRAVGLDEDTKVKRRKSDL